MFIEQLIGVLEWFLKNHDTEDWSNDAENLALITFKLHVNIHNNIDNYQKCLLSS